LREVGFSYHDLYEAVISAYADRGISFEYLHQAFTLDAT
jgi:hypothetical protein